mmetsp:Transcript_85102/g.273983  ORF Transcript_85102/g.273983 Transcript_85102/m.273983 type:complete len:218 (-) Transcript_85102:73-726(-)
MVKKTVRTLLTGPIEAPRCRPSTKPSSLPCSAAPWPSFPRASSSGTGLRCCCYSAWSWNYIARWATGARAARRLRTACTGRCSSVGAQAPLPASAPKAPSTPPALPQQMGIRRKRRGWWPPGSSRARIPSVSTRFPGTCSMRERLGRLHLRLPPRRALAAAMRSSLSPQACRSLGMHPGFHGCSDWCCCRLWLPKGCHGHCCASSRRPLAGTLPSRR